LAAMDQPTMDGVNTYVVSGLARGLGLTVVLSGLGGDELFGGYELFETVPKLERLRARVPAQVTALGARAARWRFGSGDRGRKLERWLGGQPLSAYALQRELFDPESIGRLTSGGAPEVRECFGSEEPARDVNAISKLELSTYMRNVLLRDSDVMSMAHGLELRVPLLDDEVVELVARVPAEHKVAQGRIKPLLVDAVRDLLPPSVHQRDKMGFTLPFESWLRGPMRAEVESRLADPDYGGGVASMLDSDSVRSIWEGFQRGETSWSRPWALYVLKAWGERHL